MEVEDLLLGALEIAKQNRNDWVSIRNITDADLSHCYISTCPSFGEHTSATFFFNAKDEVKMIALPQGVIGISINSNYFMYAEMLKVIDMGTHNEFILNAKE